MEKVARSRGQDFVSVVKVLRQKFWIFDMRPLIREHQDLLPHLNRIKDFGGSHDIICITISTGTWQEKLSISVLHQKRLILPSRFVFVSNKAKTNQSKFP